MKRAWVVTICLLTAAGCFETTYRIQMEPTDGQMRRVLDVQRRSTVQDGGPSQLEADELAALEKVYTDRLYDQDTKTYSYSGKFGPVLPDDVGGTGLSNHSRTSMGQAWGYVERFRGLTDLAGRVQQQFQAANRLADILIGWLEGEVGRRADWPKLRAFLDQPVRTDLKNLALFVLRYSGDAQPTGQADAAETQPADQLDDRLLRFCLYLSEHDYIAPKDAMALSVPSGLFVPEEMVKRGLRYSLAHKADIGDQKLIDDVVALFEREIKAESQEQTSLREYLRTTPEYQKLLARQKEERASATQPSTQSAEPQPLEVLVDHAGMLLGGDGDSDEANLEVTLAVTAEPFATNGRYDEQAKTITWQAGLEPRQTDETDYFKPPVLVYAFWVQPDEAFQVARFGSTVLAGHDLYSYCLWHQSLSAEQAKAWDAYVASLAPGAGLADKLKTPPADVPGANDVCEKIAGILFPPQTQETK